MTMTYPTRTDELAASLSLSFNGLKTRFFRALKEGLLTGPFSKKELRDDQVSALVSLVANETETETDGETETFFIETETADAETKRVYEDMFARLDLRKDAEAEAVETDDETIETENEASETTETATETWWRVEKPAIETIDASKIARNEQAIADERKKAFASHLVNTILLNNPLMTNVSETQQSNDETIETATQYIDIHSVTPNDTRNVATDSPTGETQLMADETRKPATETDSNTATSVSVKYNKWPLGIFCFVMFLINLLDFMPKNWGLWATAPHIVVATFIVCLIPCWMEFRFGSILLAIETRDLGKSFLWLLRNQWMALFVLLPAMGFQAFNIFELTWDVVKPDANPNHILLPYFMTVFQLYGLIETVNMQKK